LVRFAVVAVRTRGVELVRHLLARAVQVVFVRDGVDVDARRHVVFVEDDVVRERLVVDEFNRFTSLDRDGRRLFIGKSRASVSLRARSSSSSSTRAGSPRVRIGRRALTVSRGSLGGVRRVARASRRVASRRVGSRTKKPSSPLSPPSLMVAANAGEDIASVVAAMTAACARRKLGRVSVSRRSTRRRSRARSRSSRARPSRARGEIRRFSIADARAQTRDDARSTGAFATPDRSARRPRTAIEGANSARVRIRDAPS